MDPTRPPSPKRTAHQSVLRLSFLTLSPVRHHQDLGSVPHGWPRDTPAGVFQLDSPADEQGQPSEPGFIGVGMVRS